VYGSDYPPNATINNGTYTLKGTPPFIINTSITENGASYSGGCITSLTDKTGCPGIINHPFSAGAVNNDSSTVLAGTTPAAITSNTAASSGGGFTYRWVRSGTSSATYTGNNAGHSFASSEVSTAGTWTYYREVRDNTCATTTWSRSTGSYVLTIITCPYTGSDLYLTSSYPCQQRTSGAKNWQAYIRDSRDSEIYRIVLMPDSKWWLAQNVKYAGTGSAISGCKKDECGRAYTWAQTYASYAGGSSGSTGNVQGICPPGWLLPIQATYSTLANAIGSASVVCAALRSYNSKCTPVNDSYGWASIAGIHNGKIVQIADCWYTNDNGREDGWGIDIKDSSTHTCEYWWAGTGESAEKGVIRCFRQL
jgi:uncharacterized protein (TIGR02145 family)